MKESISLLGGAVSCGVLVWYAAKVLVRREGLMSPASWLMWLVLDSVMLGTTWAAGKPIWLPLGFVIGAASMAIALFIRAASLWEWSEREWLCAALAAIAAYIWQTQGAEIGVLTGALAVFLAGVPLFMDIVRIPERTTLPIWACISLGSILTILGSDLTFTGTVFACTSLSYNAALTFVIGRKIIRPA